jgi:glycosyltransferase involved in cell wall biosynthesis
VTEPNSRSTEAATIATRMAQKLGCETIALLGCARPALFTACGAFRLAGFDAAQHVDYAAAVLPHETWLPLGDAISAMTELPSPLPVISARVLDAFKTHEVRRILAMTPGAIVIDVDDHAGFGIRALREQLAGLSARGIACLHAELIAPVCHISHRRSSPALIVADGHDPRPAALVETGFHSLRLDPEVDSFSVSSQPARICIISYEVVGPSRNGGIGTANTSLALALARAGHEVTVLFTGGVSDPDSRAHWRRSFSAQGVSYHELVQDRLDAVGSPYINVKRAWAAYEWVLEQHKQRPFDVIHGPECQGHLAYIALAKRHGVAFAQAQIVTGVHSSTRWCYEANRQPIDTIGAFTDDYLEQAATGSSDVVVSPSGYMLSYLRSRGWRLPHRTFVQQYVTPAAIRDMSREFPDDPPSAKYFVREIVFFGRLEVRKGIETFCDALDELAGRPLRDFSITFMGSAVQVRGESSTTYIERRARAWPWTVKTMTDVSHADAIAYLGEGGRLAVMPSLVDNSPNTVYEAMALGIPMIVSRSGGTAELITLEDLERCSFAGQLGGDLLEPAPFDRSTPTRDHQSLSETLCKALEQQFVSVRPAVDRDANDACHVDWHAALASKRDAAPPVAHARSAPRVSVILSAPELEALPTSLVASLTAATDAEVVVAVARRTCRWEGEDRWRVIETGDVSQGRALELAAQAATGGLLLALPIDVIPEARATTVLAHAAAGSDAEVFVFPVWDVTADSDQKSGVAVPVGGPAVAGLSYPYYGASGFAIRVEALRSLGGFNESPSVATPSIDLLNRAALGGHRFDVVPAVIAQRVHPDPLASLSRDEEWLEATHWEAAADEQLEVLRPFQQDGITPELPALYRRSQEHIVNQRVRWETAYGELRTHTEHLQQSHDALALRIADGDEQRRQLKSQLDVVYTSRSWRITWPLRALGAAWRAR